MELAEQFDFDEARVTGYLKKELSAFDLSQYGTVVLGCTHFPYFTSELRKLFPEGVDLISGSAGTARNLQRILEAGQQTGGGTGRIEYYQSGVKVEDAETLQNYKNLLRMLDEI
ncbi:Glutamate racemase 2 [compost metagenome]